ncbi:MAG: prohibitin family protein [Chitinophagales bacterium]|nr:prohibitin family protein [Chitinophagales bacterium]
MRMLLLNFTALAALLLLSSCATIMPDEVGVKRRFGRVQDNVRTPGLVGFNPFSTRVVKVPVRTMNLAITENLPSKEGLTIRSESSILYRVKSSAVPKILRETGLEYEDMLILPVFRSAASDICSRYDAKDMHSARRAEIESEIQKRLIEVCEPKGFIIEAVLLKSISLPQGLTKSIEAKLEAEQDALRMQFVLDRQRQEAQRQIIDAEGIKEIARIQAEGKRNAALIDADARAKSNEIEAEGIKKANDLINASLSPNVLRFKQIEAFMKLSTSNNTKTIITDGKTPMVNLLEGNN